MLLRRDQEIENGIIRRSFNEDDNSTYPYTYQAVVNILDEDGSIQVSYFADTIYGLVAFLKKRREDAGRTKIFEIYRGRKRLSPVGATWGMMVAGFPAGNCVIQ